MYWWRHLHIFRVDFEAQSEEADKSMRQHKNHLQLLTHLINKISLNREELEMIQ